jgi:hypothetical protein
MKPSEQCKQAGLSGLSELMEITGVGKTTLINWAKNKPKLFNVVVKGAVSMKPTSIETINQPKPH